MIVADFRGGLEIGVLLPPVTRAIFVSFALALVPACCSESALLEFTAKGRALITKTFREHATAMEEAAGVLSKQERLILLRLLKKLGTGGEDES